MIHFTLLVPLVHPSNNGGWISVNGDGGQGQMRQEMGVLIPLVHPSNNANLDGSGTVPFSVIIICTPVL